MGKLGIRLATGADHEALTQLWRRSVEATHQFLPPDEVERLFEDVRRLYLPGVEALWLAELPQTPSAGPSPWVLWAATAHR